MNFSTIKRFVPASLWRASRTAYYRGMDILRDLGPYIRSIDYCGVKVFYNRGNAVVRRLKKEKIFEEDECVAIAKHLKKIDHPVMLDIGANIGLISVYTISKVPDVTIYAFEPGPVQRSFLELTVKKNRLENKINVLPFALGKERGTLSFYSHDRKYVAHDGFIDTGRARGRKEIKVQVETLDEWWNSKGRPKIDLIKVDTEGAELWVFMGGKNMLETLHPVIYFEIEPQNLRVYPYSKNDIVSFLETIGYSVENLPGKADTFIAVKSI